MATITSNPTRGQAGSSHPGPGPVAAARGPSKSVRKLIKTVTWSLIAFLTTGSVGWLITGSLVTGGSIGLACRLIKIPSYWLHETVYDHYWQSPVSGG